MTNTIPSTSIDELANLPANKRVIHQVESNLPAILSAREQGHTWDAIARTMNIRRPTLINTVKTLLARKLGQSARQLQLVFQRATVTSDHRENGAVGGMAEPSRAVPTIISDFTHPNSPNPSPMTLPASKPGAGIVSLGRAKPEQFNF